MWETAVFCLANYFYLNAYKKIKDYEFWMISFKKGTYNQTCDFKAYDIHKMIYFKFIENSTNIFYERFT